MAIKKRLTQALSPTPTVRRYLRTDVVAVTIGASGRHYDAAIDAQGRHYVDIDPADAAESWAFDGYERPDQIPLTRAEQDAAADDLKLSEAYGREVAKQLAALGAQLVREQAAARTKA